MKLSTFLIPASLAVQALAAPAYPELTITNVEARGIEIMSNYYNLLARKVAAYKFTRTPPTCDLSNVQMPSSSLPGPSAGLTLTHVAVGRGTQNYTCTPGNATAAPTAAGALATLFNASCIAAAYPDVLEMLPSVSLQYELGKSPSSGAAITGPTEMFVSGHHFFNAAGAPFFDLHTTGLGDATCAVHNRTAAPVGATATSDGAGAVPWLKLNATSETGNVREVYRLSTAGGNAPATCEGMDEHFVVEYAALYWFYGQ